MLVKARAESGSRLLYNVPRLPQRVLGELTDDPIVGVVHRGAKTSG
jgi:hypothetical protein